MTISANAKWSNGLVLRAVEEYEEAGNDRRRLPFIAMA
jgi:hypothetical protein